MWMQIGKKWMHFNNVNLTLQPILFLMKNINMYVPQYMCSGTLYIACQWNHGLRKSAQQYPVYLTSIVIKLGWH